MNPKLEIKADWEKLDSGSAEERATFAAIGIRYNHIWLTEAEDAFVKRIRQQVHLSGYRLAEWLAWNWWRLRWEPRRTTTEWAMAHKLSTIGGGYVWPNITIVSDGERVIFDAQATEPRPDEPLHYIARVAAIVTAEEFESAVDRFVEQVRGQLREERVTNSNLESIWSHVLKERAIPDMTRRRKLEALLGSDPDEINEAVVNGLVEDSKNLGDLAVEELAADRNNEGKPLTADDVKGLVRSAGFDSDPGDAVRLNDKAFSALPQCDAAWKRGVAAASALRAQEQLDTSLISNDRLCRLAGVPKNIVQPGEKTAALSFAFDETPGRGSIVLRSNFEVGRRFNLARLIGDRVAVAAGGRLRPATRTSTYRQKLQRAFAGEFLCPFEKLVDFLKGDFSAEMIEDAAAHFNVSDRTVRTHLANHRLIGDEDLISDFAE